MARNCISAVQLMRTGKWDLNDVERWLNAVISNDSNYLRQVLIELKQRKK